MLNLSHPFQLWVAAVLLAVLTTRASAAPQLATDCPRFMKKRKAKCYIDIPYRGLSEAGLQAEIPVVARGFDPRVIDLGRLLFFDPVLSRDNDKACASCHNPLLGLSDGRRHAPELTRSTPTLWNTALKSSWFWDGRARDLRTQAEGPLFSPREMASEPASLMQELNAIAAYRQLFREAFGRGRRRIQLRDLLIALESFQVSLLSFGSRYDQFAFGHRDALSKQELRGFNLFRSFLTRCSECHTPPLFTNHQVAVLGSQPDGVLDFDRGVGRLFPNANINGAFVVPTLRNITRTAPYMHAGQHATLHEVLEFYNDGGGRGRLHPASSPVHWHIRPIGLSSADRDAIVSFLGALVDERSLPNIPKALPSGLPLPLLEEESE